MNPPDRQSRPESKRAEDLERMCRALAGAEARCDQVTQARAEARLEAALAAETAARSGRRRRRLRTAAATLVAAAALGGAAIGARRWLAPVPLAVTARVAPRFEPYIVSPAPDSAGGRAVALRPEDAGGTVPAALTVPGARLDVPAGWLVRARLSPAIKVTVIGPARLSVSEEREGAGAGDARGASPSLRIALASGRLLGELDGGRGQRLRVETPAGLLTVTGTLFAVETIGAASRVSVAHGRVRVSTATATREVGAGEAWLTSERDVAAIPAATIIELDEHHRIDAPAEPAVPLEIAGAPVAADVWLGGTRVGAAPAWMRVAAQAVVRLHAPGRGDALWQLPEGELTGGAPRPWRLALPAASTGAPSGADAVAVTSRALSLPRAADGSLVARGAGTRARPGAVVAAALAGGGGENGPASAPGQPSDAGAGEASGGALDPAPSDAAGLYRVADRAFAAGDRQAGRAALQALIARRPGDRLADAARYELALMAHASGADGEALDELSAIRDASLTEPAHYLRCLALVAQKQPHADGCLVAFREQFPRSAHDADALAALAGVRLERQGCAGAAPLWEELARRYPRHPSALAGPRACTPRPGAPH